MASILGSERQVSMVTVLRSSMYHGTKRKGLQRLQPNVNGVVFLTPDKHAAEFHTVTGVVDGHHAKDGDVHHVQVDLKNPVIIGTMAFDCLTAKKSWIDEQKASGHDAIVSDDGRSVAIFDTVTPTHVEPVAGAYKWGAR